MESVLLSGFETDLAARAFIQALKWFLSHSLNAEQLACKHHSLDLLLLTTSPKQLQGSMTMFNTIPPACSGYCFCKSTVQLQDAIWRASKDGPE